MQATDNYSDFVEERSAGVIVVLAEQGERRERRTALPLSHAAEPPTSTCTRTGVARAEREDTLTYKLAPHI